MSLVGDIILELRSRIPDAPNVTAAPQVTISALNTSGGTLTSGVSYTVVGTAITAFGESAPTPPQTLVLPPATNSIQVTFNNLSDFGRAYLVAGGSFPQWFQNAVGGPAGSGLVIGDPNSPANIGLGSPPTRSTAFLPDSDGNFIGAFTMYRLFNRAISEMVKIAGGIVDVTGVQTLVNQSMYRIDSPNPSFTPGQGQGTFYQFVNAWYDGYPMDIVPRSMMYLRNSAAGFSGILSYEQDGPQSVIQVWPQSNRTGGNSQLVSALDEKVNFFYTDANGGNFLSIGLAQIDSEIVAYSTVQQLPPAVPNQAPIFFFNGVTRGLGGTTPAAHAQFASVTELNLRLSGYRMPPLYQPGDAAEVLAVPQAWETPLVLHMLSQVRSMEQDDATAKALLGDFVQSAEKVAKGSRLGRMKPRQIPIWGQTGTDARNVNGIGFGWLVG